MLYSSLRYAGGLYTRRVRSQGRRQPPPGRPPYRPWAAAPGSERCGSPASWERGATAASGRIRRARGRRARGAARGRASRGWGVERHTAGQGELPLVAQRATGSKVAHTTGGGTCGQGGGGCRGSGSAAGARHASAAALGAAAAPRGFGAAAAVLASSSLPRGRVGTVSAAGTPPGPAGVAPSARHRLRAAGSQRRRRRGPGSGAASRGRGLEQAASRGLGQPAGGLGRLTA